MEMIGHRCKAGNYEVHEPATTDAQRAANTVQEDLLAEQALHHGAVCCVNHSIGGIPDKLTTTRRALVILRSIMNMTIFLVLR